MATLLRLFLPNVYRHTDLKKSVFASYACLAIDVMQVSICEKIFENFINLKLLFKVCGEIQPRDNYVFIYLSL